MQKQKKLAEVKMGYKEKEIEEQLKLAEAVSNGVIKGETSENAGHLHRFKVGFIDNLSMFVGKTSSDGQGPHIHYIGASVYDVVNEYSQEQTLTEEEIVFVANRANMPANIRSIIEFYNLTEIRLVSSPSYPDEHVHTLVLRYADGRIDKMGRKIQATLFTEGLRKAGGSMENNE